MVLVQSREGKMLAIREQRREVVHTFLGIHAPTRKELICLKGRYTCMPSLAEEPSGVMLSLKCGDTDWDDILVTRSRLLKKSKKALYILHD